MENDALIHPAALIFPIMSQAELAELAEDIRARGLHEPIWTLEGLILDGRNRYLACVAAGVEPKYREWSAPGDPLDFVFSQNMHRRHLTTSQRAMVAVARMKYVRNAKVANLPPGKLRDQAAEALKVSGRSVQDAAKVEAASPELARAVRQGTIAVSRAARIADLPPEKQLEALQRAEEGAREAREGETKKRSFYLSADVEQFIQQEAARRCISDAAVVELAVRAFVRRRK